MVPITLLAVTIIVTVVNPYKFPEGFKRCRKSDPDFDNCLKSTIQNALHLMGTTGIPSLNLPAIDPLEISSLELVAGNTAVHLVQKYYDVRTYGFLNSTIENAHLDLDRKILTFTLQTPELQQRANYNINGKLMMMPVAGNGDSELTLFNVTLFQNITFKEEIKNNNTYFKIISQIGNLAVTGAHVHFGNVFNGDEQLGAIVNNAVNDNWREVFEDIKDVLVRAYYEVFKQIGNKLFNTVPVNEIFLD